MTTSTGRAASLSFLLALLAPAAALAQVPAATVVGPIPAERPGSEARNHPFLATDIDLARYGYVEQEFFVEGRARHYDTPALQTGAEREGTFPYRTRIVVRRPASAANFTGTVALEWNNVTAGYDLELDWFNSHEYFLRAGWAWVGVSAQRVGVDALKEWSPGRYGTLDVTAEGAVQPSDALSYDIFAQVAQALRSPGAVAALGELRPTRIIATGHSQSAGRLITYHNSVHPLHQVVDGFIIHGSGGALRTDLPVKVMRVQAETDVRTRAQSAEPDHANFRRWEVAGTSHVGFLENSTYRRVVARDRGVAPGTPATTAAGAAAPAAAGAPATAANTSGCDRPPYSRIPFHHVLNASYEHLLAWIQGGPAPPAGARYEWTDDNTKARDSQGNALGGIRLPGHVVPTAVNTGDNSGAGFCRLYGSHEAFSPEQLRTLYPTSAAYVRAIEQAIATARREGFLLPDDAEATLRLAREADFGWR